MFEDERERSFYVAPEWVSKPRFGQVTEFLSFRWNESDIWVAVIQGWNTKTWCKGDMPGTGPQELLSPRPRLDVVEVTALEAIARRIKLHHADGLKEIVFDTANGSLAAEMF